MDMLWTVCQSGYMLLHYRLLGLHTYSVMGFCHHNSWLVVVIVRKVMEEHEKRNKKIEGVVKPYQMRTYNHLFWCGPGLHTWYIHKQQTSGQQLAPLVWGSAEYHPNTVFTHAKYYCRPCLFPSLSTWTKNTPFPHQASPLDTLFSQSMSWGVS